MPSNSRQPPAAGAQGTPASPSGKGTAKYTNKDGSKFITVPKNASTESSQSSPTAAPESSSAKAAAALPSPTGPTPPVNRKKQKRRAKAAAKAAAEQALHPPPANGSPSPASSVAQGQGVPAEVDQEDSDADGEQESGHNPHHSQQDGYAPTSKSKKSKKKKKKGGATAAVNSTSNAQNSPSLNDRQTLAQPPAHPSSGLSKEKIWNTSSQEERERIKEFWLGLGEDERKSLVKVEKDAVLKKMKEQQKHTCSCTVCGRKRTAIEEELEGLYDAYYEELEQFANHPNHQGEGPPMMGPPRHLGPMSGLHPSRGLPSNYSHQPSHGRIVEHVGEDEEDGDEEYSDEELDDDEYSDEEPDGDHIHRPDYANDFFNFGNSLTVQGRELLHPERLPFFMRTYASALVPDIVQGSPFLGGILTVADDLLKNDGKKFIEMMEQLAERRMAREEDAKEQYLRSQNYARHTNGGGYGHNHPPPEEEDYDEDEEDYEEDDDEEEYDSQEEEVRRPRTPSFTRPTGCVCSARPEFEHTATNPACVCDLGYHDRGAANGRRQTDVPDIRRPHVRAESSERVPRESRKGASTEAPRGARRGEQARFPTEGEEGQGGAEAQGQGREKEGDARRRESPQGG